MSMERPIQLFLVRHGNTFESGQTPTQVGARTDLLLTDQGRVQGHNFATYLASHQLKPDAIYAGALKRQIETAQILERQFHLKNKIHLNEPALTEIDYGPWEGLTAEEIIRQWPAEYNAWTKQSKWPHFFGGTEECHLRDIRIWLEDLRKRYKPGEVVLGVTSNGVIRFFYTFDQKWKELIKTGQIENLKVKTGHFCKLLLFQDSLEIESWNVDPKQG